MVVYFPVGRESERTRVVFVIVPIPYGRKVERRTRTVGKWQCDKLLRTLPSGHRRQGQWKEGVAQARLYRLQQCCSSCFSLVESGRGEMVMMAVLDSEKVNEGTESSMLPIVDGSSSLTRGMTAAAATNSASIASSFFSREASAPAPSITGGAEEAIRTDSASCFWTVSDGAQNCPAVWIWEVRGKWEGLDRSGR